MLQKFSEAVTQLFNVSKVLICFLMNQVSETCSSQLFDIFDYAVSRFPFIIRSIRKKTQPSQIAGNASYNNKGLLPYILSRQTIKEKIGLLKNDSRA